MYINKKNTDYLIKKILNFKINDKKKNSLTKIKSYFIYKIKYEGYDEEKNFFKW